MQLTRFESDSEKVTFHLKCRKTEKIFVNNYMVMLTKLVEKITGEEYLSFGLITQNWGLRMVLTNPTDLELFEFLDHPNECKNSGVKKTS